MRELVARGFVDLSYMLHCGVYVLVYKGRVVYVGQSISPARRIGVHSEDKAFDQVFFLRCRKEDMNDLERDLIHRFKPQHNRDYVPFDFGPPIERRVFKKKPEPRLDMETRAVVIRALRGKVEKEEIFVERRI